MSMYAKLSLVFVVPGVCPVVDDLLCRVVRLAGAILDFRSAGLRVQQVSKTYFAL